jgi:hypothetical protein
LEGLFKRNAAGFGGSHHFVVGNVQRRLYQEHLLTGFLGVWIKVQRYLFDAMCFMELLFCSRNISV